MLPQKIRQTLSTFDGVDESDRLDDAYQARVKRFASVVLVFLQRKKKEDVSVGLIARTFPKYVRLVQDALAHLVDDRSIRLSEGTRTLVRLGNERRVLSYQNELFFNGSKLPKGSKGR